MTHDEIVAECVRRDEMGKGLIVHYIALAFGTFKLHVQAVYWSHLSEAERYCMVQYGNLFDSAFDAKQAIARALAKPGPT